MEDGINMEKKNWGGHPEKLWMNSCKHTKRCGKPTMKVDFRMGNRGFPHLCWFTLRKIPMNGEIPSNYWMTWMGPLFMAMGTIVWNHLEP